MIYDELRDDEPAGKQPVAAEDQQKAVHDGGGIDQESLSRKWIRGGAQDA